MIFVKPFFQKFLSVHCKVVQCATHTRPPFYISPRFSASCFCLNRTFRYDTTYSFRPLSDLTLFSFAGGEGVKQRTHARTLYPTGAPHRTGSTSGIQRRSRSQEPQRKPQRCTWYQSRTPCRSAYNRTRAPEKASPEQSPLIVPDCIQLIFYHVTIRQYDVTIGH